MLKTRRVRYRGVFVNDEIFGPGLGGTNIRPESDKALGPKTYQGPELMLRLRVNYIWSS